MTENTSSKQVGMWLSLGVFFMPYFFAWVLLKPGHSRKARVAGFGWLAAYMFLGGMLAEQRVATNVRNFCSRFSVGESFEQAVAAAMAEADAAGDKYKRPIKVDKGDDVILIRRRGAFSFSGHVCKIEGADGKISKVAYFKVD
jgi:hypothetical protein